MPLLRPPDPQIPTRKFYVRIEEPLAVTLDRYAEFLGTTGIDHVINQALEFVFRKDGDFKEWVNQHPQPAAKRNVAQRKKPKSVMDPTTAQARAHGPEAQEASGL